VKLRAVAVALRALAADLRAVAVKPQLGIRVAFNTVEPAAGICLGKRFCITASALIPSRAFRRAFPDGPLHTRLAQTGGFYGRLITLFVLLRYLVKEPPYLFYAQAVSGNLTQGFHDVPLVDARHERYRFAPAFHDELFQILIQFLFGKGAAYLFLKEGLVCVFSRITRSIRENTLMYSWRIFRFPAITSRAVSPLAWRYPRSYSARVISRCLIIIRDLPFRLSILRQSPSGLGWGCFAFYYRRGACMNRKHAHYSLYKRRIGTRSYWVRPVLG
jgi:hypothetical protein